MHQGNSSIVIVGSVVSSSRFVVLRMSERGFDRVRRVCELVHTRAHKRAKAVRYQFAFEADSLEQGVNRLGAYVLVGIISIWENKLSVSADWIHFS